MLSTDKCSKTLVAATRHPSGCGFFVGDLHDDVELLTGQSLLNELFETIFVRTWWRYAPHDDQWFSFLYHWFNLTEAAAWFVFAALVMRRYRIHRHSSLEVWYAIAFLFFGLTDLREAWEQSSWLIWIKLINLIVLAWLRRAVMTRYYRSAKVY